MSSRERLQLQPAAGGGVRLCDGVEAVGPLVMGVRKSDSKGHEGRCCVDATCVWMILCKTSC